MTKIAFCAVFLTFFANAFLAESKNLMCIKCHAIVLPDGTDAGSCWNGAGNDLFVQACKENQVCMKYQVDVGAAGLIYRDCADKSETCDQFRERQEAATSLGMKAPGKAQCSQCSHDTCNSSVALQSSPLLAILLTVYLRYVHS